MKKLMILGAGIYQVPLIKKAKEMGLYTLVVSIPGDYPGFSLSDENLYINTVDADAVLLAAKEAGIDGICTTGTDVAIGTLGKVCDAMNLCGVSASGAEIACDKILMKQAFAKKGVRTAPFRIVSLETDVQDVAVICRELGYPLIFKAVDSSGSRGITIIQKEEEIEKAVNAVKEVTRQAHYLIETALVGDEFGAQAFVQNGKVEFVLPHGDYVFHGNTGVPIGHYAPYQLPNQEDEIYRQVCLAVEAMGLDNCAINADFMLCDGEPYVLEIGARGGATCLIELVGLYYGYNYYEKMIRVALGESVDFSPTNKKRVANASHLLLSDRDGTILEQSNQTSEDGSVVEVAFDYQIGDKVRKFRVGPDRIGHVIVTGENLEDAERNLNRVRNQITVTVKEG